MRLVTETTEAHRPVPQIDSGLSPLSDADLLDAWNSDRHGPALAELVQRYSVMVLSVCRRRCRNASDADDAFQTTFLYLARNSKKIRSPERLAGWLHRVAQRAAVATLKSAKRETEAMVDTPDKPDDPLDRLAQRHEANVLDEELADLPEHYRTALVMHIYDDRPLQAMADHFGTTIGSIRGRLQRGKQMLARRLRHRGVVPVLALAAANAWTVSSAGAADASQSFLDKTEDSTTLPDPPIEPNLLESLLSQGVRLMPSIYTTAGILSGAALLAFALTPSGYISGQTAGNPDTVSLPAAKFVGQNAMAGMGGGGGLGGTEVVQLDPTDPNKTSEMVWSNVSVIPEPTSVIAERAKQSLDRESDFDIHGTLMELPKLISDTAGVPVLVDDRGIEFAKIQLADHEINFEQSQVPLRTALRTMLQPFGLKTVVEDEGLVITADPAALVHKGIGTSRWINVDEDAAKMIDGRLQEVAELSFRDVPLSEAVLTLAEAYQVPVVLDARSLEEIGVATDTPVTIDIHGVKLENALNFMLSDLDLTYTIRGESLVITTSEAEEQRPLHRIYWLESTGIAAGDYDALMSLITSTISPDAWAEMGGPSTMSPMGSSRPALLISTTYEIHHSIENLFQTLRETHFGVDPVMERVQVPAPRQNDGMGGGGFF